MDTATLVEDQIEDGYKLVKQLTKDNFDVTAACWIKTSEDGERYLYVVSNLVDEKGLGEAYRAAFASVRRMVDSSISMSEVKLIGSANPIAKDILEIRNRSSGSNPSRYRGPQLGGVAIDEAFIYPASAAFGGDFQVLVKGRDEVWKYLEKESQSTSGVPGEYLLARDGRGNLVAIIAGHSFVGAGTMLVGGKRMHLNNGLIISVQSSCGEIDSEASSGHENEQKPVPDHL